MSLRGEDVVLDWILGNISKISFEWLLWGGLSFIVYGLNTLHITLIGFVVTLGYKRSTRSSPRCGFFVCLYHSDIQGVSGGLVTFYASARHGRKK